MLADAGDTFLVVADKEPLELSVGGEASDEVVGDGGQGIVASEALVESFLLLGLGLRRCDQERWDCGERGQGDIQKRHESFHIGS